MVETLPSGFSYEGSDLSKAAVVVDGQTVAFTLLGDERFTYTVAAPSAEGPHSFSGVLLDSHLVEQAVEGDSSISVGPKPTPEPTATPTPEPTPEPAIASPTPAAVPEPTPTRSRSVAPPPPPDSEPEEGPLIWLIALLGVGAVLAIVVVSTRFWRSQSQS